MGTPNGTTPPPAARIVDVSKSFGTTKALDGVSFDIPSRSIFGLLGPNGAGKTTLFSIVAQFIHADAGHVEVLGTDVRRISRLQGRLSILPQDALFQRNVPILEQLSFFLRLNGLSRTEAESQVRQTLERVGLGEHVERRVHSLSHGMVKRLGVAQAFLGAPEVIVLDEPTSGLDPKNARQIRDLVRELHERATIVISSHNLAEIQELCDHVAILDRGRLVACGSVEEITRAHREVRMRLSRALEPDEAGRLAALAGVGELEDLGQRRYRLALEQDEHDEGDRVVSAILATLLELGLPPRDFHDGNDLETHFLAVTGGSGPTEGAAGVGRPARHGGPPGTARG